MLVGFLTDAALLQNSRGKNSLADILREIYQKHHSGAPRTDGNAAILNVLEKRGELRPIAEKYIKGAETIAWQTDLAAFGIETKTENFSTKLSVKSDPNGREKDLLKKLGYNNWRK
jgi:predicted metalloprotease with PDZ domain